MWQQFFSCGERRADGGLFTPASTRNSPHTLIAMNFFPSFQLRHQYTMHKAVSPTQGVNIWLSTWYMRAREWLNRNEAEKKLREDGLTCSDNPLDFNAGGVQLLGKLMDSPVRVLVGFRVNVRFGAWKFNCRKVRGLLLRLNMHTTHPPQTGGGLTGKRLLRPVIQRELLNRGEAASVSKREGFFYTSGKFITHTHAHTRFVCKKQDLRAFIRLSATFHLPADETTPPKSVSRDK